MKFLLLIGSLFSLTSWADGGNVTPVGPVDPSVVRDAERIARCANSSSEDCQRPANTGAVACEPPQAEPVTPSVDPAAPAPVCEGGNCRNAQNGGNVTPPRAPEPPTPNPYDAPARPNNRAVADGGNAVDRPADGAVADGGNVVDRPIDGAVADGGNAVDRARGIEACPMVPASSVDTDSTIAKVLRFDSHDPQGVDEGFFLSKSSSAAAKVGPADGGDPGIRDEIRGGDGGVRLGGDPDR